MIHSITENICITHGGNIIMTGRGVWQSHTFCCLLILNKQLLFFFFFKTLPKSKCIQQQCPCSIKHNYDRYNPPSALSVQYNIVISCENVMAMPPITTPNTNLHILRITRILFLTATACPALTVIIRGYHRSENTHCVFISFHGDKWWWFYCPNITQTSFTNTAQSVELETKVHPKVRNYEKAITRAFSWLKAATTAFTFQT